MRFAGDPVSSVKTIPAWRTRSHPPKWTFKAGALDLLIPIELSQARAESDLNQDLRGDLSDVMSPRESHHSEETLSTVPLGQFQAQRSDNTTTNNIAHYDTNTPSQSEINSTITKNIVAHKTSTSSHREIFSETGTGTSSSEDVSHNDGDIPEEHPQCMGIQSEHGETSDSSGTSKLQHPPKVKYFPVTITFTITVLIARPTHPCKVKKQQNIMPAVSQAAGKLQDHHHLSLATCQ